MSIMTSILLGLLLSVILLDQSQPFSLSNNNNNNNHKSHGNQQQHIIKVCQNKDCRKRYSGSSSSSSASLANLYETFRELLPPNHTTKNIRIEKSGCLSQCGKGPNVSISKLLRNKKQQQEEETKLYFGIKDVLTAASLLEAAIPDAGEVPMNLLAAANVIMQSHKAASPTKKEKLLSSVISVLNASDEFVNSVANGHAHVLRADARLNSSPPDVNGASRDARRAVEILPPNEGGSIWRVLADAEEASGNTRGAIDAWVQWSNVDPAFRTKANNEIRRLSLLLSK